MKKTIGGGKRPPLPVVGAIVVLLCFATSTMRLQQQSLFKILEQRDAVTTGTEPEMEQTASAERRRPDSKYDDFTWSRYCENGSPCIALLSAADHDGIVSKIDQYTLRKQTKRYETRQEAKVDLRRRVLVREALCAIYKCDVIMDYNDYHANKTMWLSDHGKYKVGQMPPHWNKVAALKRWLPHYDGILLMDADSVWVDFGTNVYDLYDSTSTLLFNKAPELIMIKRGEISRCVVDSWWYYGTAPGCRYFKYPENYRAQ